MREASLGCDWSSYASHQRLTKEEPYCASRRVFTLRMPTRHGIAGILLLEVRDDYLAE